MTEEDSDCSKKGKGAPSAAHVPDGNSVDTVTNGKLQAVQIPEAAAIQEASRTPTLVRGWCLLGMSTSWRRKKGGQHRRIWKVLLLTRLVVLFLLIQQLGVQPAYLRG